ncbi:dTDP-4-dehydrorhamnose 3,5-epimerase family protein [Rhizobium sp. YIM 134829]|uniref:dTDP-4-dehydrorhamnose 3,5-epimerase family protein n=1 Tax=Rhizobium sp. YIM 134829 TaxID=3390453 RepID=UPI0039794F03
MSDRFAIETDALGGVLLLARKRLADERGHFSRVFCAEAFASFGWTQPVSQINESRTRRRGTVRGLHYQRPPFAEKKLVSCLEGAILDVAVDIRHGSPTFLQSFSAELSAENGRSMLVPEGFAHGFQALTDEVQVVYATSAPYAQDAEQALHSLDPALSIAWPLEVVNLSPRDAAHPFLSTSFTGLTL